MRLSMRLTCADDQVVPELSNLLCEQAGAHDSAGYDGPGDAVWNDCRERSALRGRPLELPSNDELRILGALPPRSGLKAAEVDGVERFPRTRRVQQPYLKGSRAVDRACDREGRLQRHRIRSDVCASAILRARDLGVGARIEISESPGVGWSTTAAARTMGIRM